MKALIAEDEVLLARNIKEYLEEFSGEQIDVINIAENGAVALDLLENDYDLVILDFKMPEVDGAQVIRAINRIEPPQTRPWVVLITAYPGAYETARLAVKMGVRALLKKPFELPELMGVIEELMKARRRLTDFERRGVVPQCQWTLTFSDADTAFIQVKGLMNFVDCCSSPWSKWDLSRLDRQAEIVSSLVGTSDPLHRHWKFYAKDVGTSLFKRLFVGNVQESFVAAGASVLQSHHLRVAFAGPRRFLKLPFEFLHDETDYLILRHPMRRFVSGVRGKGRTSSILDLSSELQENREKLRILLIASNTPREISGVDSEIASLYDQLSQTLSPNRFEIKYLPTEEATYNQVMNQLTECRYHILHYAGHGHHDERFPERSCLFFWEKENRHGDIKVLSVDALKSTLRRKGHDLQFAFLSCCSSTATSDESVLLDDDFLGMADGLVLAGVPSVLGFRWPVSDRGAETLALAFYESLFEQGDLDTALFQARCKVKGSEENQGGADWLSPILIVQG